MKKQFLLLLLVLLISGMLFAQSAPNTNYSAIPDYHSVSSETTASLFTNELDAAVSLDTGFTGPYFTDLDANYVFAGVIGNMTNLDNNYQAPAAGSSVSGAFHHGVGELPWTVMAKFDFTLADVTPSYTSESDDTGPATDTTDTADKKQFSEIDTDLGFLIGLSEFATGLYLNVNVDDNRTMGVTNNGVVDEPNLTTTVVNGDSQTSDFTIGASVPFSMDIADMAHYGVFSYQFFRADSSRSEKFTGTNAETGTNYDEETTDIDYENKVGIFYKVKMPMGKNLLVPFAEFGLDFMANEYEDIDKDPTALYEKRTDETEYTAGVDVKIGAEFIMNLKTSDWVNFRMRPDFSYAFSSDPYEKQVSYNVDGTKSKKYTTEAINYTHINTIAAGLDVGVELKPENWPLGVIAGSQFDFSYENTTTKDNTAYVSESGDPDDALDNDDSYDMTKEVDWNSEVNYSIGFFLPLPEDYRLDFSLNGQNITSWENFTVQLIVPID